MNLEAIAMRRAEEQIAAGAWRAARIARPARKPSGPRMTDEVCPKCKVSRLARTNKTGVCGRCWDRMTLKERSSLAYRNPRDGRFIGPVPQPNRGADRDTVERARQRLAAKGIVVEAA